MYRILRMAVLAFWGLCMLVGIIGMGSDKAFGIIYAIMSALSIFVLLKDGGYISKRQKKDRNAAPPKLRQIAEKKDEYQWPDAPDDLDDLDEEKDIDIEDDEEEDEEEDEVPEPSVFVTHGREKRRESFVAPECEPGKVSYRRLDPMLQLMVPDYVVLDLETTGLSAQMDKIIEIAAVKISDGKVVDSFRTFVDPERSIPGRITQLTGITDQDVAGAPAAAVAIPQLYFFLDNLAIVAHNANFDISFLAQNFERYGIDTDLRYVDTLALAREAFPRLPNYKLATLISTLNLAEGEQTHRALDDVYATSALYTRCRERMLSKMGQLDLSYQMASLAAYYEGNGDIDNAIKYYETAISYGNDGVRPYQRLTILYRKARRYEDEIRVCDKAVYNLFKTPGGREKAENFSQRKEVAKKKLDNENAAKQKAAAE